MDKKDGMILLLSVLLVACAVAGLMQYLDNHTVVTKIVREPFNVCNATNTVDREIIKEVRVLEKDCKNYCIKELQESKEFLANVRSEVK